MKAQSHHIKMAQRFKIDLNIRRSKFQMVAWVVSTSWYHNSFTGPKILIFENVENLIFLRSETNFEHQIFIPEQSEMVRELKNTTSGDF